MAAELFVDTSAWFPLADPRHPDHRPLADALTNRVRSGVRVVTTNLILAETHALLLRRVGRGAALRFLKEVRREPLLVETSTSDFEVQAAEEWLARFDDQNFSLADGVSFVIMTERGIIEALTLDHHFAVAGFTMVPLQSASQ
ncbi:MAG: PIN domain-containing protein [Longimicrobiales bacterium]|nr:PIN domain-containing protein [Longimicrobiales bacterium]